MKKTLFLFFHADLSNALELRDRSEMDILASHEFGASWRFPNGSFGDFRPAWPTNTKSKTRRPFLDMLALYDDWTSAYDSVIVGGYSRGAILAHLIAHHRKVDAVISYGGYCPKGLGMPLQQTPVFLTFNRLDLRRFSRKAKYTAEHYREHHCDVEEYTAPNGWSHWSRWDARINDEIAAFLVRNTDLEPF